MNAERERREQDEEREKGEREKREKYEEREKESKKNLFFNPFFAFFSRLSLVSHPSRSPFFAFFSRFSSFFVLFAFALLPRLLNLGQFLTADEFLWVDRARNFLAGITNPAFECDTRIPAQLIAHGLECTLRTGHPGVTTMWSGVVGFIMRWLWEGRPMPLHEYVVAVATNPLDASFISWERFGVVFITALSIVAMYGLTRRLFNEAIAFMAALLMALNPFHIALSRVIHHDALSTSFMILSILCALIYWGELHNLKPHRFLKPVRFERVYAWLYQRRWLILSGICAGLAFLSKLPSLFLGPMVALIGLWSVSRSVGQPVSESASQSVSPSASQPTFYYLLFIIHYSLFLDGLFWFAVSITTFIAMWPAMWVIPLQTIEVVFFLGSQYSSGGHAKGNFFWGEVYSDPGLFFYPVTWLYRTTPFVMIGLLAAIIPWLKSLRRQPRDNMTAYIGLIFIFICGYTLMMSVVAKKQERYLLPIYPWLDLIAAIGLINLINHFKIRLTPLLPTPYFLLPTSYFLLFTFYLLLLFPNYPYYFTYANPLLGGLKGAEQSITLGWGEGLDLAADYLNQQGPPYPRVTSWYESTFAPFYRGETISYSEEKGKALAGDMITFYVNQKQRHFPDDAFFDYFESRFQPLKVITLHNVDHVWIYPSLGIDHYVTDQTYTGIASLLAWQWQQGDKPLLPGQSVNFDLYWEYLGKEPQEQFFMQLADTQGRVWTEGASALVANNPPVNKWRSGEILQEQGILTVPVGMAAGAYQLQIGFHTQAEAVQKGYLLFTLPVTESRIMVGHQPTATLTLPSDVTVINQKLGHDLTLLGAKMDKTARMIKPQLFWRVERAISATFEAHVGLMNAQDEAKQAWFNLTLAEIYQPEQTTWQPGDIIQTQWQLDLLPDLPNESYHLVLVLGTDIKQTLPLNLEFKLKD